MVIGTASARPRGTIVRSGWNFPDEPTPTAPLLISANPGCPPQIAFTLAERGQDIAVAHTAEVLDTSIRCRSLPDSRDAGRAAGGIGSEPQNGAGGAEFQPRREQGGAGRGVERAGGRPVRVRTIPLIRTRPPGVNGGVGQAQPEAAVPGPSGCR